MFRISCVMLNFCQDFEGTPQSYGLFSVNLQGQNLKISENNLRQKFSQGKSLTFS